MTEVLPVAMVLLAAAGDLPGTVIKGANVAVGDPIQVKNLTVFPIYGEDVDLGPMISLEAALEAGDAVVREQGSQQAQPAQPRQLPSRQSPNPRTLRNAPVQSYNPRANVQQQRVQIQGGGATVGTLVIENKSQSSIIVLAGTVVRGGKQDRQIGQDFVIGPEQTVPVDAFCVEHGRWSASREGKNTAGKFEATAMLAPQKVRAAAQYKGNQSEVWAKVAEVNEDNRKKAASDTLMATYDDAEIVKRREKLIAQVTARLTKLAMEKKTVGLAYAVDGKVRGARWFFAHQVFAHNRKKLIGTAAVEAITADARRKGPAPKSKLVASDVIGFIDELRTAKVEARKKTESLNENVYRRSKRGYSSEAVIMKDGKPVPVTTDFLME